MSIQLASLIVQRIGPCRLLIDLAQHEALARELRLLGCQTVDPAAAGAAAPTAAILAWASDLPSAGPVIADPAIDTLVILPAQYPRDWVQQRLFADGWERHPGDLHEGDYAARANPLLPLSLYRRARTDDGSPLRAGDVAADAAIARYALAARHVRPGDRVLLDGAASPASADIIATLSRAQDAVQRCDAGEIAPHSIDLIVAFDTRTDAGIAARLQDYARLLKPDGRLILGQRTNDAAADWPILHDAVCTDFLLEARYVQIVPLAGSDRPRALHRAAEQGAVDADWLIAVASANPLDGAPLRDAFRHPAFGAGDAALPAIVDFGGAYENPYLYRVMVQMGERLDDEIKLARLAEYVAGEALPGSADRGAAIAVLGYRVLEMRLAASAAPIVAMIDTYRAAIAALPAEPHRGRWAVSLAFLAARLSEMVGDGDAALHWYDIATGDDWRLFSPLLATKAVAASFYGARLHLAAGDADAARAWFKRGFDTSLRAIACPHGDLIGDPDRPLPFYMQELAEVVDMGSQCATALASLPLWQRDPGLFWRQVDTRRFGLASWARDLERENNRLAQASRG